MMVVNDLLAKGFDGIQMVNGLASHVRNVLMATDPQTTELIEASDSARQRYAEQAKRCKPKFLYQALKILNQCDLGYRQSSNKRLLVELTLIQVAQITQEDDGASSGRMPCKRLKSLFKKLLNEAQPKMAAQVAKADQARSTTPDLPANDNATSSQTGDTTPDTPNNTPKKGIKLSGIGVSLHNMMLKKEDNKKKEDLSLGEAANESSSFTDDDLRREWLSMCNRMMGNRQYNALAKRMMNASIKTTEMPHAEVIVENTLLLNDIQKILPRIKVTMAQRLHNGNLDLTLRLAEPHEIAKRLTPQEFLQKLTETYPSFASFKDEMKLEIER
jgi:DNA polymerase-3 subunit gamma/tau